MPVTYLGKAKIDTVPYIKFECITWKGPDQPGRQGKYIRKEMLAPQDQSGIQQHKRHITVTITDGQQVGACISPSVKGFSDLAKRFRWGRASKKEEVNNHGIA